MIQRILATLALCLGLLAAQPKEAKALRCASYIGFNTGGACTAWKPDLILGGRDVANNYSPSAYETVICAAYNYQTYCQAADVNSFPSHADLTPINPGWYGNYAVPNGTSGNLYIRSVRNGSLAQGMLCSLVNFDGTCTLVNYGQSIGVVPTPPRSIAFWR